MEKGNVILKDNIIEVEIISRGRKGDGVAKHNGFVIMIPKGELGKRYKVKITDVYDNYAFGIITECLEE